MGDFGGFGGHCSKSRFWGFWGSPRPCVADDVIEKQIEDGLLKPELREKLSYVLLRKHRHQTKKPIHRSLADIGKSVSSNTGEASCPTWWHPGALGRGILGEGEEEPKGLGHPCVTLDGKEPRILPW